MRFRNPFKPETPQERTEREELELSVRRAAMALGEIGRGMVQDSRYGRMRAEYEKALTLTLRLLIHADLNPNLPDPQTEFVDRIRKYQQQLRALLNIVDVPKGFAAVAEQAAIKPAKAVPAGSFQT